MALMRCWERAAARWSGRTNPDIRACTLGPYAPVPTPTAMPTTNACHDVWTCVYAPYAMAFATMASATEVRGPKRSMRGPTARPETVARMPPDPTAQCGQGQRDAPAVVQVDHKVWRHEAIAEKVQHHARLQNPGAARQIRGHEQSDEAGRTRPCR